jgi:uncharacterized membrane protein
MIEFQEGSIKTTAIRSTALFCLFFLISFGLGYPTLNRYDPRQTPGLTDVQTYAALVTGSPMPANSTDQSRLMHLRFRVLVPAIARPFYLLAKGRGGSWDPVMFGLLVANSLFVAATALLIVFLGQRQIDSYPISLVASLLYLANFAIPNLRLAGLVDAGEGFFLLALLCSLATRRQWLLPFISILGALTKESFIPLSIVFMAVWWFVTRKPAAEKLAAGKQLDSPAAAAGWIVTSWLASFAAMLILQRSILGYWLNPIKFASALHGNHDYLIHFASSIWDRNFWYIFIWLLPLAIPHLNRFPKSWLLATAAACAMAFLLDGYYGGAPGTVGRALFSVAGPLLSLSAAPYLCRCGARLSQAAL